jgi:hypothetical protein
MSLSPPSERLDLFERWIAALRSGKYKQGRFNLRSTDDDYCCLGVLCDIVNPGGWGPSVAKDRYRFGGVDNTLPDHVANGLGMGWGGELPTPVDGTRRLATLNDTRVYTFDQIADVIEEQFIGPLRKANL